MTSQRIQHLFRQFRQHRRIVFPINHKTVSIGSKSALHIRHRTNRRPIIAQLIHRHMVPQTFPHVIGGHTLTHHIRVIRGNVKKSPGAESLHRASARYTRSTIQYSSPAFPVAYNLAAPATANIAAYPEPLADSLVASAQYSVRRSGPRVRAPWPSAGRDTACSSSPP